MTQLRVAFCYPTMAGPTDAFLDSLARSVPLLDGRYEHRAIHELGCPYISGARATMLRKAMQWGADVYVFLDDDVAWRPEDLVALIEAEGEVVAGTYRYKTGGDPTYMGRVFLGPNTRPIVRDTDGAIKAICLPAGFLKVTAGAVAKFMAAYPELNITGGDDFVSPDLFNHGAHKGVWYGEDYAFCRNWMDLGGEIWLLPDLDLDHHGRGVQKGLVWKGNFHRHLLEMGQRDPVREAA